MRKSLSANLRLIFLFGDLLIVNSLAVIIWAGALKQELTNSSFFLFITFLNGAWLSLCAFYNPYKFSRVSRFAKIVRTHFTFILIYLLVILSGLFIFNASMINLVQLIKIVGAAFILFFTWRIFYFYLNRAVINKKLNFKNVVIVGFGDLGWEMRKFFRLHPEFGYRFLGYFDTTAQHREANSLDDLDTFCKDNQVQEIFCCLPYVDNAKVKHIVDYGLSNLIKVKLITDYRGFFSRGVHLETYDNIPVLNVAAVPLDEQYNLVIKRIFDIVFSSFVIVFFLSWLVPLIAIAIKITSRGPVFFKQARSGKGNKPFNCLKFRTMIVHQSEFRQATMNDHRVTLVGKILRKSSLDELPQFINVLRGQMSIIGPRPHPIKLNEEFLPKIEKFMARHYIKPGITGLAQSKGFRGETSVLSMKARVKLDRFYIENWSFLLDLKIIVATVISLVRRNHQVY